MAMRENGPVPNALGREEQIQRLFARFGMEVSDVFKDRYLNDPWVYHLTNAVLRLQDENDQLRRRLPAEED